MPKDNVKKIHLIYGCVTALLIVTVAVLLIVSCVNIYHSGDRPFSREVIASALQQISIPCWLCLIAVIGAVVLHVALPVDSEKLKSIRLAEDTLCRYSGKFSELTPEEQSAVRQQIRLRRTYNGTTAAIITALAVYPVIYYADVSHFGVSDLNGDIVRAILVALIPTAAALVLIYFCGRLNTASILRQIEIYKAHPIKPEKVFHEHGTVSGRLKAVRCILLAAAVVLIVMGIANDGVADVVGKAIRICTECIGLG